MNNGELIVSAETLNRIFVLLLYAPIVLISYWKLIPRLSPTAKRIASGFLATQVILIAMSLEIRPASAFERWLWDIDSEWNIPSAFASTQMALVGFAALVTAWLAWARPVWQRLYLVGVGLVFLYLGLDEFFAWKDWLGDWKEPYKLVGVAIITATIPIAVDSPRPARIWHLCLLTGLSLVAAGGFAVDGFSEICGNFGFLRLDKCLQFIFLEECLEFLGVWLVLVAMLGQLSDAAPRLLPRARRFLYALPALWILLLFSQAGAAIPLIATFIDHTLPAAVAFESDVYLHGFSIERDRKDYNIHLYLSPRQWDFNGLGYSVHLVDQVSEESVASRSEWADHRLEFRPGPGYVPVYRQSMELEIPPQAPANRALWIVLTLWRKQGNEFVRQRVIASDLQLLDDAQVVLNELVIRAASAAAAIAVFDSGFTLDAVDLPSRARPGETLTISFAWHSNARGREDYVQFLHFGHDASDTWWVYDQPPLGARLPTRLWYNGLADSETWQIPLPADLAPGQYSVFTGLYRQSDLERAPASDANGTPFLDGRVPLGSLTIER